MKSLPSSLSELEGEREDCVILRALSGSRLYGLASEESDHDIRGLFVVPLEAYAALDPPSEHIQDERGDIAYHALRKFLGLAANANPNSLELLFLPPDCVLKTTPAYELLVRSRSLFVTCRAFQSYVEYARSQVKRARGQNKWVNNPQPEPPPTREEFCWVLLGPWPGHGEAGEGSPPLRPQPLRETDIDLSEYHCAGLEHVPNVYRLYHYGPAAHGVQRGGKITVESIPLEDERTRIRGLLVCDETRYERARRDHRNYWTWRRERNEARWRTQESGEIDYDPKNMMHTLRLLASGANVLQEGEPKVRFEGAERRFLLEVRAGRYSYVELLERIEAEVQRLESLLVSSRLPQTVDPDRLQELLWEVTALHLET